ncbi:MAG: hypothetical protein ACRCY8_04550 [Dermatophilaceae bacterium]
MSRSTTRWLYVGALLVAFVGVGLLVLAQPGVEDPVADWRSIVTGDAAPDTNYPLGLIGVALAGLSIAMTFAALVGALVRTAQLDRWGWFVLLLLFSSIALLVYVIVGPTARPGGAVERTRTA